MPQRMLAVFRDIGDGHPTPYACLTAARLLGNLLLEHDLLPAA